MGNLEVKFVHQEDDVATTGIRVGVYDMTARQDDDAATMRTLSYHVHVHDNLMELGNLDKLKSRW